jgi:hypothetical protein
MPQDRKAGTGLALIEDFVRQIGGTAAWEVAGDLVRKAGR